MGRRRRSNKISRSWPTRPSRTSAEARSPHRSEDGPPPERGGDGQAASRRLGKRAAGEKDVGQRQRVISDVGSDRRITCWALAS
jgi:hypothetical protein